MAGKGICFAVAFGCAALFYAIGQYAGKLEKPMGFWANVELDRNKITDVAGYNRENERMWKGYSVWYAAAGVAALFSEIAFLILLVLSGTLGLAHLIRSYGIILKKYSI